MFKTIKKPVTTKITEKSIAWLDSNLYAENMLQERIIAAQKKITTTDIAYQHSAVTAYGIAKRIGQDNRDRLGDDYTQVETTLSTFAMITYALLNAGINSEKKAKNPALEYSVGKALIQYIAGESVINGQRHHRSAAEYTTLTLAVGHHMMEAQKAQEKSTTDWITDTCATLVQLVDAWQQEDAQKIRTLKRALGEHMVQLSRIVYFYLEDDHLKLTDKAVFSSRVLTYS